MEGPRRTEPEPLDHQRREQPEQPAIREPQQRTAPPQIPYVVDVEHRDLRDDEEPRDERHAPGARAVEVVLCEICDDACLWCEDGEREYGGGGWYL